MNEFIVWGEERKWNKFSFAYNKANEIINVDKLRKKYDFDRVYELNERLRNRYMKLWNKLCPNKDEYTNTKMFTNKASLGADGNVIMPSIIKFISIHHYIGKTDTEGNKIYADCSIVECIWNRTTSIGYFTYNTKSLQYDIRIYGFAYNSNILFPYNDESISNLKVIGTLQENKELLDD